MSVRSRTLLSISAALSLLVLVPAVAALGMPALPSGFSLANPLAAASAYFALAISLFVLAQCLRLGHQAKSAHREALVLLLAMAAHSGVSPDSPEFIKAQEAIDGKRPRAAAAAKAPRRSRAERKAERKAAKAAAKAAKAAAKAAKVA